MGAATQEKDTAGRSFPESYRPVFFVVPGTFRSGHQPSIDSIHGTGRLGLRPVGRHVPLGNLPPNARAINPAFIQSCWDVPDTT